jgi:DNA-binding NtrC family response regulator
MASARILVADDEPTIVTMLARILKTEGHEVFTASGGSEACETGEREQVHLALVDLTMPDRSGIEVLKFLRERVPEARVIIMTAYASAETAVEAMKLGALDYLIKPIATDELKLQVRRAIAELALSQENRALRTELERLAPGGEIIGTSPGLREAVDLASRVADAPSPVLVLGESGTGKELIARAIHRAATARRGPFLAINCGALAESLLERELFGHEKGAFTGADAAAPGLLEAAADGTILLDEIAEMSPALQVKLLRVLEGGEFMRVGGTRPLRCHARFVAATNKELAREVSAGRFRQDLYYRLNVLAIRLPPLRDRGDDVLVIADHYLARFAAGRPMTLSGDARAALRAHTWPGNVRELRNVIERAVLLACESEIRAADLSLDGTPSSEDQRLAVWAALPHQDAKDAFERWYIERAFRAGGGNVTKTAEKFGLDRKNLEDKLRKYGLK